MKPQSVVCVFTVCLGFAVSQDIAKSIAIDDIYKPVTLKPLQRTCCPNNNYLSFNLKTGKRYGVLDGVTLLNVPTISTNNKVCDKRADLRINFQKLVGCIAPWKREGCLDFPWCGRRMLRADLFFDSVHANRRGHVINIGDSRTDNGYGGDSGTQSNDAEIHGTYPDLRLYKNDYCLQTKNYSTILSNALNVTNHVTIYVSNEYVRITNDKGLDERLCHKCLFALNGQADSEGPANEDIYLSMNKVILNSARTGAGLCRVNLRWQCPC